MAQSSPNQELVDRFVRFYRNYYRDAISRLAQRYPNEQRSLHVDYDDLYRFDQDLADDYLSQPDQISDFAEEALRMYDLPADVSLGQAHVRLRNLPDTVDIRSIRVHDNHVGRMIAVSGIVRKATDVRPKITEAAFECQRCGTMTYIPQSDGSFQEPHECQGCERQGPFRVNYDQSEFVDSQKLRVQESPEGLRGGETPQSIDIDIEDDITGKVTAGDHVTVTGVLHIDQVTEGNEKSQLFDLYMDGVSVEIEDEQFEDMEIDEADKREIIELSNHPDIYDEMVASVAPSIYGYDEEKLAMILQLFSGVTKHLPDGSRIRGDLHMLLIGDPGTGKCQKFDTKVVLGDGTERMLGELVESRLENPVAVDDGVYQPVGFPVQTVTADGSITVGQATKVWKRDAPDRMYRVRTESGREVEVTPSHPLFVQDSGYMDATRADELAVGDRIATRAGGVTNGGAGESTMPTSVVPDGGSTTVDGAGGHGGIRWDRIESIETTTPDYDWVYDLEVAGTHTYLGNGVVSHNSQLLSYIRNIAPRSVYTSGKGSSSAGLCVTGDTLIHTASGFEPVRELVKPHLSESVTTETSEPAEYDLYTFDRTSGEMTQQTSSYVWRMPKKECRRVETAHGKELETSTNTPVLVCGDDGIEWREISEIEAGDFVAVPKYEDPERSTPSPRAFFEFSAEKLKPDEESITVLRRRLREQFGTLRNAAAELDLTEDFIYDSLSNRHLPLSRLDRILDAIDVDRSDVGVARSMLGHGNSITIPESFDEDLMYLIGLVFGDGDIMLSRRGENRGHVRLSNSDEKLLRKAASIVEKTFDKSVEVERQDERVPCIRIHSATIARFFQYLGMESPKDGLSLDPRLTTAEHADAFLRGLFDADGSVSARDDGGSSIQFSTISDEFARQVQLMLETYGIRARRRERDRRGTYELEGGYEIESKAVQTHMAMYGQNIDIFAERIGFESTAKSAALDGIVGDATRRGERLPVGGALAATTGPAGAYYQNIYRGDNPSRKRARAMLKERDLGPVESAVREAVDASLVWDEVVSAVDTGEKELFDLTVPETNNFIGNGIVTHNTAAAVRDDFGEGQQWSLEAGALVLADQGIAAVDELDKMRCVTGDTIVHLADGSIRRIEELARDAAETGTVEELDNGRTIRDADVDAWTMTDDGRIVSRPVTAVHEYEAPTDLTDVRLETGERLTATDDHPFFVFEDGERVERAASDLSSGDWVYVPRAVPQSATDGGSMAVEPGGPQTAPTDGEGDGLSPGFSSILGYLSGDGNVFYDREHGSYGIRFTNAEEELLADFERACRKAFDAEPIRAPSEQRADGVETVRLSGRDYADAVLEAGMNLRTYDQKSFPEGLSNASKTAKAAFVRALADSEGTVDTQTGNVRIASASYELLLGTKHLLLEFGISSQLQTRERDGRRNLHVLAITSADSIRAFEQHIGFVLDRKASSLETVRENVSGDRTILDVIPECGDLLAELREALRLYQSECGIGDTTYCNFENGDANVSLRLGREIFDAFEQRREMASADLAELTPATGWETLEELRERYHVSQTELASMENGVTQQEISRNWGQDSSLRSTISTNLRAILTDVAQTDLSPLRELVSGDVKWRRVSDVRSTVADADDDRVEQLEHELADRLGCDETEAVERTRQLLTDEPDPETWNEIRELAERYDVSLDTIADGLDVDASTLSRWTRNVVNTARFDDVRAVTLDKIGDVKQELRNIIQEVGERKKPPHVYDLTVDGTHNFVANGMVVHNSEDRSAMHQALEQQSISISKAGINATLKSRCSLLGAANPKYGRFDQYEPIGEQIDLEPALISRFDLIFTVTDQPDPDKDAALAEHILRTNYAGELETQRTKVANPNHTAEEVASVTDTVDPEIDPDLLRKYIAYAKRTCFPTMTDEAKAAIRDFYVDLRAKGADEDAPVPVTARKLEALVRLAEASARVRLSDTVERADADRVIEIVRSCLQDIGVDPETGEFDADVIETGTSKSQRDRIKSIKDVIETVDAEYEKEAGAPLEAIVERAEAEGIEESKVMDQIEQLRRKGDLYSPKTDQYKVV
ncbi:ATPase [Haloplanus salinus]|uniref:DNA helicase n=1 Tax=Haloplanus salinus TaxID=1126245 RepID=A0A368NCI3_9EURY|nr:LAGLIDADG family homing endonuclease [Haloplanus salinus]RCU47315.1 ATPase [Haloplanus salinus]